MQSHGVSPQEVLTHLQHQVEVGAIMYIEHNGVGCYADPRFPPTRCGKMQGRKATVQSKTGDLVGKVVLAVREIVEMKKEHENRKRATLNASGMSKPAGHLSALGPSAHAGNGGYNRNTMATMKDILAFIQNNSSVVVVEDEDANDSESITPTLLKAAVKRAVVRGFLTESGKYFSIDNSKTLPAKGKRGKRDSQSLSDTSHLLIEDGDSSDSSLNESFLSSSLSTITSPPPSLALKHNTGSPTVLSVAHNKSPIKLDRGMSCRTPLQSKSPITPRKGGKQTARRGKAQVLLYMLICLLVQLCG